MWVWMMNELSWINYNNKHSAWFWVKLEELHISHFQLLSGCATKICLMTNKMADFLFNNKKNNQQI